MEHIQEWKEKAAREAAKLVDDRMKVGLGSGSTLSEVVKSLGREKSEAKFVSASIGTQRLAEKMDLDLISLQRDTSLDLTIDGADEVDSQFSMIKGGGGAHTRERIVAGAAEEVVIVVDRTKLVEKLGKNFPVAVEIVPFSHEYTAGELEKFGAKAKLRKSPTGRPFVTDNGNYVIDLDIGEIEEPGMIERDLNQVPGVIDNGIFSEVADRLFVGYEGGCKILSSKRDFLEFTGYLNLL